MLSFLSHDLLGLLIGPPIIFFGMLGGGYCVARAMDSSDDDEDPC